MAIPTAAGALPHDPRLDDAAPPRVRAGWALFDMRVATGRLAGTAAAAAAACKTSNGRDVLVSLRRVATPPACSLVQLYTDDDVSEEPTVVSADGDLLIHMVIALVGTFFTEELSLHSFFVYNTNPESPSLLFLPPPPSDWKAQPGETGIARKGNEFVVANLRTHNDVVDVATMREVEVAVLWLYRSSSSTRQWETKQLAMPHNPEKGLVEFEWNTDTVFSFRGFICWVDFHRGILYCDVFSPDGPELGFLRFPGIEMWRGDREFPNMYRTVSTCRGHLRFVDVDDGRFRSTGRDDEDNVGGYGSDDEVRHENDNYDVCTITTWTLRMPEFEWEEDASLLLTELSSLPSYQDSPLPRAVPIFPIVDMQENNIVHFVMNVPGFLGKAWMVTVDMKDKSLVQYALYENPVEAKNCGGYDLSNVFLDIPFVSTQLFH
ncbi:unnamed protein product [Urochloa decumbens]|uniref:DUF1618 domain-containing protein n=1 Tax=Urochloa decumbens TaxID=240449 RepID=A0ABC8YJ25_9POAL